MALPGKLRLLGSAVVPLWTWLNAMTKLDAKAANDQHDKARLRLEICKRCPLYTKAGFCDAKQGGCGCFMPIKAQLSDAKCPQGRW